METPYQQHAEAVRTFQEACKAQEAALAHKQVAAAKLEAARARLEAYAKFMAQDDAHALIELRAEK